MAKRKKGWIPAPPKKAKPKIPDSLKAELTEKANELIETKFKPWKLDFDKSFKENGFT